MFIPLPMLHIDDTIKFWSNIIQRGENECWPWIGSTIVKGYGQIRFGKKMYLVHRVSYYIKYKKDPGELLVLHDCDNPPCCNPKHLFLGTHEHNAIDCCNKGRHPMLDIDTSEVIKLSESLSEAEIARRLGCHKSTINRMLKGRDPNRPLI
jgi:hypothetical protein